MVVPPSGAAKGKMRSPVKTCIASSPVNRIAPASITKPTMRSARAEPGPSALRGDRKGCARVQQQRQRGPLGELAAVCVNARSRQGDASRAHERGDAGENEGGASSLAPLADPVGRRGQRGLAPLLVKTDRTDDPSAVARVADSDWAEGGRLQISGCGRSSGRIAHNGSRCGAPISFSIALSERRGRRCNLRAHFRSAQVRACVRGRTGRRTHRFYSLSVSAQHVFLSAQCYLQDLYVAEVTRGGGVGRALIAGVVEAAKEAGAARVYWNTHETNAVARRLYDAVAERPGFIQYRIDLKG